MKKIKKNKNIFKKKIIKIFNLIKKNINGNLQIITEINKETNIKVKYKNIENIEFKKNINIKINIYKNYKKFTIKCNNFKKKTIINFINYIKKNIKYISKNKYNILPPYNLFNKKYNKNNIGINFKDNISIKKMIKIATNLEKNSINLNNNNKIINDYTIFNKNKNIIIIYNDYKKIKKYISKNYLILHSIIIKNNNIMENDYDYIYNHKILDLINKYKFLSKKIINRIIYKKNQKKINTIKSSVILNNKISTEIFYYLFESIKGKNIYNKTSFMYKKLKKKILPSWLSIVEDPHIYKGIGSKLFDNEGLNTYKYYIVNKGILKTWILNYYYSNKLNIKNTCNSGGIHNWKFINKKKKINFKKLIKIMNNGLIIDKLLGQGVNITTGLYSKGISGFLVKNGKIKYYINEAIISGNLKKLYKNIIYMSNDININSNIRSGSILIKNIQIIGNK